MKSLLDAGKLVGSLNVVELAAFLRWKLVYDLSASAESKQLPVQLEFSQLEELQHWLLVSCAAYSRSLEDFCKQSSIPITE